MLSPMLPLVDSLHLRFDVAVNTATDILTGKITDIIRTELAKMPKPECHTCSTTQLSSHLPSRAYPQEASTSVLISPVDYTSPRKKRRLADLDSALATHDGPPPELTFLGGHDSLERTTAVSPSSTPSLIDHQLPAAAARKVSALKQQQQPPQPPQLRQQSPSFVTPDNDGHKPPSSHGHGAAMKNICSAPAVSVAQPSKLGSVPVSATSLTHASPAAPTRTNTHAQIPLPPVPWSPIPDPSPSIPPQVAPSPSILSTSGSSLRSIAAATASGSRNPPAFANTTNESRPTVEHSGSRTRMNTPVQLREGSNPLKRSIAGTSVFTSLRACLHLDFL